MPSVLVSTLRRLIHSAFTAGFQEGVECVGGLTPEEVEDEAGRRADEFAEEAVPGEGALA